jgi:hypothetical protein
MIDAYYKAKKPPTPIPTPSSLNTHSISNYWYLISLPSNFFVTAIRFHKTLQDKNRLVNHKAEVVKIPIE